MRYTKILIAVVVVCLAARTAATQSFQGGLRGTVRDAQGVMPSVTIALVNEENVTCHGGERTSMSRPGQ